MVKYEYNRVKIIDLLIDSLNGLKSDIGEAIPLLNDNEDLHQYTDYSKEIVDII